MMITILYPEERKLLKLAKEIKSVNRKIDITQFQILIHQLNNDENQRISSKYDLIKLRDQKEELMTLINNI